MRITRTNAVVLAAASLVLSACSDNMVAPTSPTRAAPAGGARVIIPTVLPGVVLAGADGGNFFNATTPSEATRVTGAFWDNISSDDTPFPNGSKCNIGFFVTGAFGHNACLLETLGTQIPSGFGGNYWGDNGTGGTAAGRDPSSFTFNGQYQYDITLIGAFSFGTSEVGYFIHDVNGYHFFPQAPWGAKSIGTTVTITPGSSFGLYIGNHALTPTGSCDVANGRACSDATGGFTGGPFQQFSLFINHDGSQLIAGIEDNGLSPLWNGNDPVGNPTNKDSDYQDYILSITPKALVNHGCTLGFWKNTRQHPWPSPYNPATSVVGGTGASNAGFTSSGQDATLMLTALSFPGGPAIQDAKNLLLKQAVAAILNAGTSGMNYPLTKLQIQNEVDAALASNDRQTILDEAARLEGFNSLEGPLC